MTQRVRFSDITVVYLCSAHNEKYLARKVHMDALCAELGFKEVVHWKSGTEEYPECLALAIIAILEKYGDHPFLLLEDNVEAQGLREFDVPEDADIVYLGLSKYGGSKLLNVQEEPCIVEPFSDTLVRVKNMLATHAIYYNATCYTWILSRYLQNYVGTKYNTDVLMTRLQPCFNVYATKSPLFYQSNRFNTPNDLEGETRFNLT